MGWGGGVRGSGDEAARKGGGSVGDGSGAKRWTVGSAAPVSKLNQSVSAFTMRKDRVSSWMEMPQRPAVS